MKKKKTWIIGHRNPDTDSVCSAIAYADLKNKAERTDRYEPKRAGELNEETRFVLKCFSTEEPELIRDVGAQVKDIEIRHVQGVNGRISLKTAWETMKEKKVVTLPVTDEAGNLEGIIITADIATSYMDVYDSDILARSRTRYSNIIETLDGTMICGNEHAIFSGGKVMVGSANPEVMEEYIEENDLVITGNRYEAQLCAIEANCSCIIGTGGTNFSRTICKIAEEHGCTLITTPYDTYTAARLINQSMPISYFMRRDNLVTFELDEYIDDVQKVMSKERHRDFPILDDDGKYCGMISRRNLLNMKKKQVILVDHNEKMQAVDNMDEADVLEIIDHHRIGSLETLTPVLFRNQPLGSTATIIYLMYREQGIEIAPDIAGLLCSAILSDTLMYRSPTCTKEDVKAAEALAAIAGLNTADHAREMFQAGSDFRNKTPEEIFYQDFKKFERDDIDFGVGQISAMTQSELDDVREKLLPYLDQAMLDRQITMVFVMLTNIMDKKTTLICAGEGARELVEQAYHVPEENESFVLEGVISRKKQLIPAFMTALGQNA